MDLKDWAPWVGIAASLVWNCANTIRGEVRSNRNAALQEFKSLKAPADIALSELRARKSALVSLQAHVSDGFIEKLKKINEDTVESFEKLTVALEILDGSVHSDRTDWFDTASTKWDNFLSAFEEIYNSNAAVERSQLISKASNILVLLLDSTQAELETEGNSKLKPVHTVYERTVIRNLLPFIFLGLGLLAIISYLAVAGIS